MASYFNSRNGDDIFHDTQDHVNTENEQRFNQFNEDGNDASNANVSHFNHGTQKQAHHHGNRASNWFSSIFFNPSNAILKQKSKGNESISSSKHSHDDLKENDISGSNKDLTKLDPSGKALDTSKSASGAKRKNENSSLALLPKAPTMQAASRRVVEKPRSVSVQSTSQGLSLGASTHIGGKNENQDISFCIGLKTGFDGAIAVFDGHGKHGGQIAKRVHDYFIKKVVEILSPDRNILERVDDPSLTSESRVIHELITKHFYEIENIICSNQRVAENSGTTATIAIQKNGKLYIASTGDSRAVLGSMESSSSISARRLTIDHRFDIESEFTMVINAGGIVKAREGKQDGALRVWLSEEKSKEFGLRCPAPGLMVSRSVGDYLAKVAGCSAVPDVISFEVSPSDKFLIVASDGLWDIFSDEEVVNIVNDFDHVRDATWAKVTAEHLVNIALKRARDIQLRTDNITVAVMDLEKMFL